MLAILPLQLRKAFTIVELMVATSILAVILLLIFGITQQTTDAWKNSAAKIESFQGARAAFESMTRRIGQATLNTYYDYFDVSRRTREESPTGFLPAKYGRYSDLHFISGKSLLPYQVTHSIFFQAPTGYSESATTKGLQSTLNGCGYFIEYRNDKARPDFLSSVASAPPNPLRYRLMEFVQPAEKLSIFSDPDTQPLEWFLGPLAPPPPSGSDTRPVRQLAQNIVALIVRPKRTAKDEAKITSVADRALAPKFEYDSKLPAPLQRKIPQPVTENQLPPLVEVVMVAVDEPSFTRFGNPTAPPLNFNGVLFEKAADTEELDEDLAKLEDILLAKPGNVAGNDVKLKYQIFRTDIPIRAAKWSE